VHYSGIEILNLIVTKFKSFLAIVSR